MLELTPTTLRIFKTSWFAKSAKKANIRDVELCAAIEQVLEGKADDLGGGVFKKRLNDNMHRSIILAKGRHYWVFEYLFAKKDRDNIDNNELSAFRDLAKGYAGLTNEQIALLVKNGQLEEICNDHKTKI
jgi:hypothetical protein